MEQMVRNTFSIPRIVSASSCRKVVGTVCRGVKNSNLYFICLENTGGMFQPLKFVLISELRRPPLPTRSLGEREMSSSGRNKSLF